jgi:hypothetical protein
MVEERRQLHKVKLEEEEKGEREILPGSFRSRWQQRSGNHGFYSSVDRHSLGSQSRDWQLAV